MSKGTNETWARGRRASTMSDAGNLGDTVIKTERAEDGKLMVHIKPSWEMQERLMQMERGTGIPRKRLLRALFMDVLNNIEEYFPTAESGGKQAGNP